MSLDPVAFKKTKHILRAAEFLRDLVARDVVRLQHLPGKVMVADLLTKAVARALFASLMDLISRYAESGLWSGMPFYMIVADNPARRGYLRA